MSNTKEESDQLMMKNMVDSHAKYQLAFLITGDRCIAEDGEWKPSYLAAVAKAIDCGQYLDFASGKKVDFSWHRDRGALALDYIKYITHLVT